MTSRRQFLQGALGALAPFSLPAWVPASLARTRQAARVLVILELEGGNDGLNTLVPYDQELYRALRPDLALAEKSLLCLDASHALHPSLRGLARRVEQGQVAFVESVGYTPPNLSHFRSRDIWHTARSQDPLPAEGWLGRARGSNPLEHFGVGSELAPRPLLAAQAAAIAVQNLADYRLHSAPAGAGRQQAMHAAKFLAELHADEQDPRTRPLRTAFQAAEQSVLALERVAGVTLDTPFPGHGLGQKLELVARILAAELPVRVFHVLHGGYDTHTDQLRDHARLLEELDGALSAFLAEMERQGRFEDVLLMTTSEFGRRARQNGIAQTAGTDHGAASMQILCGGKVRGGCHGFAPDLARLDEHGNCKATVDFRQIFASVLEDWLEQDSIPALGASYEPLDLFAL